MDTVMSDNSSFQETIPAKRKKHWLLWLLLFMAVWYLASKCELMEALDLQRYYEDAEMSMDLPIRQIIQDAQNRGVDFIYYLLLHWSLRFGIPLNAVTALVVTLASATVVSCMKDIYPGKFKWYVVAAVLFLTPITWTIAISRNMAAVMFLFMAVLMLTRKKWVWMAIFTMLSVYTHFSVLMYVAIIAICFLVKKVRVKIWVIFFFVIGFLLTSYLIPSYLINLISWTMVSGSSDIVYTAQYMDMEV